MLLYEPPPSQGDMHFRAFGFPVRVHPFFWLTTVILGLNRDGPTPPAQLLVWIAVAFISILVHELGHAFLQRRYGGHPWITLHMMGGLASCDDCDPRPASQILISLAGPAAGFLFAVATAAALRLAGYRVGLAWNDDATSIAGMYALDLPLVTLYWEPLESLTANWLVGDLFSVNILWGLVNLLPVYPLDGGRVAREACTIARPRQGIILSLRISLVVAIGMAAFAAFSRGAFYTAFLFGYLAYENYRTLQAYQGRRW